MKQLKVLIASAPLFAAVSAGALTDENVRFASAVQLVVRERSPQLQARAHRIVLDGFSDVFASTPELRGQSYRVVTRGNEVAFYFDSAQDLRQPFQNAVFSFVQSVNDRVRGTGRLSSYRTQLEQDPQNYFQVSENPVTRRISIRARAVPLRDVLRELQARFGGVSYFLPGECGDQRIAGDFERSRGDLDGAVQDIARVVGLQAEARNGTYRFTGTCAARPARYRQPSVPFFTHLETGSGQPVHVLLSLPPVPVHRVH